MLELRVCGYCLCGYFVFCLIELMGFVDSSWSLILMFFAIERLDFFFWLGLVGLWLKGSVFYHFWFGFQGRLYKWKRFAQTRNCHLPLMMWVNFIMKKLTYLFLLYWSMILWMFDAIYVFFSGILISYNVGCC